jgi:type II secretory pathway component PulJ
MRFNQNKSLTLIELIIAVSLVGVIILGINSINIFSHYQVISSDRRAKLQNDLSYCLEHITKEGMKAIGNERVFGSNSAVYASGSTLSFFIDGNKNGRIDGVNTTTGDYWIRYSLASNQLSYCSTCTTATSCSNCSVLSNKITAFTPSKAANFSSGTYIDVLITGRWTPGSAVSTDNPEASMRSTIQLPSVSSQ